MSPAVGAPPVHATSDEKPFLVVDLGRKSKKQIKRLRNGTGKLTDRVLDTVDQLKQDDVIDRDAQIVVVVVRAEDEKKGWWS